jgi:MSHA biogenesis protein MshM
MYLEHFKFNELPFSITPNLGFFCQLKSYQEALNVLLFSLRSGEGFIKIIGEVGSGKTLLCRKLLDCLGEEYITAYIPSPDLNPLELRKALARELGIEVSPSQDSHELLTLINHKLLELRLAGKRTVFLIDEAQALPLDSLEALRLLTNLETEKNKLLQVVLFGQPELDQHLALPNLRQLKQRITFSYYLPLLNLDDLDAYLFHRLAIVGYSGALFARKAKKILHKASKGVPRMINILCHKSLLIAYGCGETQVTSKMMKKAIRDCDMKVHSSKMRLIILGLATVISIVSLFIYLLG